MSEEIRGGRTAADTARAKLHANALHARFGRTLVEQLLAEHDAVLAENEQLRAEQARRAEFAEEIPEVWLPHIALYESCLPDLDCDHDHDMVIEFLQEREVKQLTARAEQAEAEMERLRAELRTRRQFDREDIGCAACMCEAAADPVEVGAPATAPGSAGMDAAGSAPTEYQCGRASDGTQPCSEQHTYVPGQCAAAPEPGAPDAAERDPGPQDAGAGMRSEEVPSASAKAWAPEDVPLAILKAARDAYRAHFQTSTDNADLDAIRAILAAVLPLHEQQLRKRIAAELKRQSHEIRRAPGTASVGTRGYELRGESAGYWMAARDVLDGIGRKPICPSSRVTPIEILNCARVQDHAGQHRTATGTRWGMPDVVEDGSEEAGDGA